MASTKRRVTTGKKIDPIDPRTRTAFHESGHAVLSAAINDTPRHVSIKPNGDTLGRSGARMSVRSTSLVQVHLAGFAAEHVLTKRRPRQLDQEIGFALISRSDEDLRRAFAGSEHHDGYRAVQEVLRMGTYEDDEAIKREVDRFYEIARESLSAVWPGDSSPHGEMPTAKALLPPSCEAATMIASVRSTLSTSSRSSSSCSRRAITIALTASHLPRAPSEVDHEAGEALR